MISLPSAVRIFLCTRDVDLRKSFDGTPAGSSTTVLGKTRYAAISSSFSIAAGTASSCSILTATGWPFGTNALEAGSCKCLEVPKSALSSSPPNWLCCSQGSTCGRRANASDFGSCRLNRKKSLKFLVLVLKLT